MKVNFRKTKIVGKIADNNAEVPFLEKIFAAGIDVAWLNTAHQTEEATLEVIEKIRKVSPDAAILIDTKGPEVRTKNVDEPFEVKSGDVFYMTGDLSYKQEGAITVHVDYPNYHKEVPVGTIALYDDATIGIVVDEVGENALKCHFQNAGKIKNKKSINTPGVHIELPALTEKDKSFIHFCGKNNVEYIIHSFVRGKQDLLDIKEITDQYPGYKPRVVSKLENREGFDNVEEILDYSDGLMVARGDLGAEVPFAEMPFMQKKMVEAALRKGKSSIVATQVLDSMIKNPRPTRAEVLDVANAVLDGSGAISMSGETAYGEYPVEATTLMSDVMNYTELKIDDLNHYNVWPTGTDTATKLGKDIVAEAKSKGSKAIIAAVKGDEGVNLYRAISAWRPSCITIVGCDSKENHLQLSLFYAIRSMFLENPTISEIVKNIDAGTFATDDMITIVEEGGAFKTVSFKELA